jgi:AraC-like DNA-binding protein
LQFVAPGHTVGTPVVDAPTKPVRPADSLFRDELLDLMASGYYRETGLTIGRLADRLGYPEHQLRRLINGQLGYRNFSAFLNDYRVQEAMVRLADRRMVRTPILTIALDLGYASIGPFNRSFKERTGSTPSEYRRQNLGATVSDSE